MFEYVFFCLACVVIDGDTGFALALLYSLYTVANRLNMKGFAANCCRAVHRLVTD